MLLRSNVVNITGDDGSRNRINLMTLARKQAAIREWLLSHAQQREWVLRMVICSVLLLGSGWWVWHLLVQIQSISRATAFVTLPMSTTPKPALDQGSGERIAALHLFGMTSSDVLPGPPAGDVAVVGIAFAPEAGASAAILIINGRQQSYPVGSLLPNGETLLSIEANRVIIERNGLRHGLDMAIKLAAFNADFGRAESVNTPLVSGEADTPSARAVPGDNPSRMAAVLQAARQNLVVPNDGLAGKKVETAAQIRAAHRERITDRHD